MIATKKQNDEVLYPGGSLVYVKRGDITALKKAALKNERKRIRLCAHKSPQDNLHEMLIVHYKDAYVRPHKHVGRGESFHVIEGKADVVLFDNSGKITEVIRIGDYASGRYFFYRIDEPVYHTLVIRSRVLVFHEATQGPFDQATTEFAEWAPDGTDPVSARAYIKALQGVIRRLGGNK